MMNFIDILTSSLNNDKAKYKKVIDLKTNNQIKFEKYKKNVYDQSSCCITMLDFEEDEIIGVLPCKHCFNKEAIIKWLTEESSKCPICRYELNFKEVAVGGEEKRPEAVETIFQSQGLGNDEDEENEDEENEDEENEDDIFDDMPELEDPEMTDLSANYLLNVLSDSTINRLINNRTPQQRNRIVSLLNVLDNVIQQRQQMINTIENNEPDYELQQAILNSLHG